MRDDVPPCAGTSGPGHSGPHSRYAQIRSLFSDVPDEKLFWVHHAFERPMVEAHPNAVRVVDVHDNVATLRAAVDRFHACGSASWLDHGTVHPQSTAPTTATATGLCVRRDNETEWDDATLDFLRTRADVVVCINEDDARSLRAVSALTVPVHYLAFAPAPSLTPSLTHAPLAAPGGSEVVALCSHHDLAMQGLCGYATAVGPVSGVRLQLFGGLSVACAQMGMGAWLHARGVDLRGAVSSPAEAYANARTAVILGAVACGTKTQVTTAMAHGVPPVGMANSTRSTPLELEWAQGSCATWEAMAQRLRTGGNDRDDDNGTTAARVRCALALFCARAVHPAAEAIRASVLAIAPTKSEAVRVR